MNRNIAAAAAAWMMLAATGAQAAQAAQGAKPCVTAEEADAFMTVLAPEAIRGVATSCAPALRGGLLGGRSETMARKFDARAEASWPLAERAMAKITGAQLPDPALMRPLIKSLAGPLVTSKLKLESCPAIDKALGLLEPLPVQNLTGLVVLVVQLATDDKPSKDLNICPLAPVRRG